MNLAELKSKIVTNDIPKFVIFTGPETGIMDIYLKNIKDKLKYQFHKLETVADVFRYCSGNSILKTNKLFLVVDDLSFLKNEDAWKNIVNVLGTNKLILKYHNYDARLSFWKKFETETVIFNRLSSNILANHLSKEFDISIDNCLKLACNCDNDYVRCQLELDKVINYAKSKNISNETSFDECYNSSLCLDINADVFDFINSVLTKNYKKMFILYDSLKRSNESVVKLLSLLYNGFKNVLIAQTISNPKNIQQNTGLNYYNYVKAKEMSGYYSNVTIENLLYVIMYLEQGIKSGQIEDDIAIDYLFVNL